MPPLGYRKIHADRAARLEPARMSAREARARRAELVAWARTVDCAGLQWAQSVSRVAAELRREWGCGYGPAFELALDARRLVEVVRE